jgi:hypothetical protein
MFKYRLRFKAGVVFKKFPDCCPYIDERVGPGAPTRPWFNSLGKRPTRRYFRAVFASIPTLDAASSRLPVLFINANSLRTCLSVINLPPFNQKQIQSCCRRSGILIVASHRCLFESVSVPRSAHTRANCSRLIGVESMGIRFRILNDINFSSPINGASRAHSRIPY